MVALLTALLTDHNYFKVNYTLFVEMFRLDEEGKVVEAEIFPFRGLGFKVHREMDIEGELRRVCGDIDSNVTEFLFQGSGWMVSRPTHLEAEVVQCLPLRGGSGYCKLHVASDRKPRKKGELCIIDRGQGVGDGGCFHLAVARHFLGHDEKVSEQQLEDFVKEDLVVPEKCEKHVSLSDIDKIERANVGLGLAVSVVYEDESGAILPVRAAKEVNAPNHIVLMLFHVRLAGVSTYDMHYALVRDPALMFAQRQQNDDGKVVRTNKVLVCWNCHNTMHTKKAYENHVEFCHKNNCQKIVMPREGDVLSFQSVEKMNAKTFRSAYLLCFDFEALQVPAEKSCSCPQEVIEETKEWESLSREERLDRQAEQMMLEGEVVTEYFENRKRKPASNFAPCKFPRRLNPPKRCKHKTKVLNNQPPFAYSYLLFNRKGKVLEERTYVGQDCAEDFLLHLMRLGDKFLPYLTPGEPIDLSPEQQSRIREESGHDCWICRAPIWSQSDLVLDHDHVTGLYLGTAHNRCNLARRETLRITCFAHNFSGYDSHFLIRAMESFRGKIDAIPLNTQKFKSLSICGGKFVFVDSCAFLPDSLANLVDMQKNSGNSFSFLSQMHLEEGQKELLLRKGVYPYSSATSEKRLLEMTSLPPIEKFYNDLRGEACSQEDYQHAKRVWESFDCKNMLDYTALYVKTDAFLLAEVVYKFRETIWDTFGLDMCLYFSLPHLAKDIMLKETGAEIELIHDQEMSDLLQRNIRGGLSYVNVRHAERRGEMGGREEDYNSSRQSMMYLDANNLYGHSMKYPLPLRNFRWMTKKEISNFDIEKQVTATNGPGYILEVDLEYPKELHLLHNSYPLAPETIEVTWNDLSPYSKNCLRALKGAEERYKAKKLTSTFRKRERYLVHGLNLKLYLQNGLILKKIHRGITFYQEKFLKPFIDNCTEKRMTASSVTEQTLWKLVCNSVYGKVRCDDD